jgi:hypothetical protein
MVSVVTVNIRFRNGATHQMSPWIRIVFLHLLPKFVCLQLPAASISFFFLQTPLHETTRTAAQSGAARAGRIARVVGQPNLHSRA